MASSSELFNNAELSLASYADINITSSNSTNQHLTDLENAGMSATEAAQFALRYPTILAVANDTASGFQATVFQAADGTKTVAIRGTVPSDPGDMAADLSLALGTVSINQIIAMVNWFNMEKASSGASVDQYSIVSDTEQPSNSVLYLGQSLAPNEDETSYLVKNTVTATSNGDLNGVTSVDVAGHSLGGYLASAFTAIYSSMVDKTYTYNSPGFVNIGLGDFFGAFEGVLPASAITPYSVASKIIRVQAESDPGDYLSDKISHLYGGTPSTEGKVIPIENQVGVLSNHGINFLANSLAVYNLLGKLDSSLTEETYKNIFHQSSSADNKSLESIVNAKR